MFFPAAAFRPGERLQRTNGEPVVGRHGLRDRNAPTVPTARIDTRLLPREAAENGPKQRY